MPTDIRAFLSSDADCGCLFVYIVCFIHLYQFLTKFLFVVFSCNLEIYYNSLSVSVICRCNCYLHQHFLTQFCFITMNVIDQIFEFLCRRQQFLNQFVSFLPVYGIP